MWRRPMHRHRSTAIKMAALSLIVTVFGETL
jgi:hypothetical protein